MTEFLNLYTAHWLQYSSRSPSNPRPKFYQTRLYKIVTLILYVLPSSTIGRYVMAKPPGLISMVTKEVTMLVFGLVVAELPSRPTSWSSGRCWGRCEGKHRLCWFVSRALHHRGNNQVILRHWWRQRWPTFVNLWLSHVVSQESSQDFWRAGAHGEEKSTM